MRSIYRNLFGWMVAVVALLAASCTDDLTLGSNVSGDEVVVSFSVSPQGVMGGRRAAAARSADDPSIEDNLTHISDGKKANMLIYAVYDENNNLLPQYGEGLEATLKTKLSQQGITEPTLGEGQTAIYVEDFPVENRILIRLLRGKTYRVAFWAQSLECKAYNTKDLKKVEVIYSAEKDVDNTGLETPNNDEMRDVFCQVAKVNTGDVSSLNQTVTLYRPLAQINVGTSGYDFETVTRGTHSNKYRYSRIQLSSAARYLSVPENKVLTSTTTTDGDGLTTEVRQTVNYDWAPLPAYYNYEKDNNGKPTAPADPSTVVDNEEFLRVDLGDGKGGERDNVISGYVGLDQYKQNEEIKDLNERKAANYTETFKYLSMCYILVPVQESDADKTGVPPAGQAGGGEYTTTLDNVKVWLATDDKGTNEETIVELTNVPVHRNWRTNIISQELLTTGVDLTINLEPMYAGEYNTDNFGKSWSGPLSADPRVGVYYDAVNDEIQISNLEGLLWLERMVNGKYKYNVYKTNGDKDIFEDDGIKDPTDGDDSDEAKALKARIMRATHQDQNPNNGGEWPTNNNFHFMGADANTTANSRYPHLVYPAKVRLMVDIDLNGIEWIPIGFANNTAETFTLLNEKDMPDSRVFCGQFEGGNHTIYNLTNKRFSASVYDEAGYVQTDSKGPYERAVQWFSVGLFGQIGQNGSVSNLHLKNVDLLGYCHVGGIAGTVTGQDAFIYNCYVDGGTITASPMYRGDSQRAYPTGNGRTFARGIFAGGIVGYLNVGRTDKTSAAAWDNAADPNSGKYASILDCDVRNLTMRAYRQIGGIVGSLNNNDKIDNDKSPAGESRRVRKLSGNNVTNVTIIADKFQPYDVFFFQENKNAFGWKANQLAWSDIFVGGNPDNNKDLKYIFEPSSISSNTSSNVIITEFATGIKDDAATAREATIDMIPLNLMPMLSSFFTDKVTLLANFTGKHSAYRHYTESGFYSDSRIPTTTVVNVPCKLPDDLSVAWDKNSGYVGMYIESIELHGDVDDQEKNIKRDRTIVTVEDAQKENDCVAYIGGRNHSSQEKGVFKNWDKHETNVYSMVFRGQPYAYTGICLAPTSSTTAIKLDNVSVYDVYQTLALDSKSTNNANRARRRASSATTIDNRNTALSVSNSNLRGYTNYGKGWKSVNFSNTVFERGANIKDADAEKIQTCEVKQNTTFDGCYFKAPYIIKIADGVTVTFNNSVATATSDKNIELNTQTGGTIEITADLNGNAVVTGNPGN